MIGFECILSETGVKPQPRSGPAWARRVMERWNRGSSAAPPARGDHDRDPLGRLAGSDDATIGRLAARQAIQAGDDGTR